MIGEPVESKDMVVLRRTQVRKKLRREQGFVDSPSRPADVAGVSAKGVPAKLILAWMEICPSFSPMAFEFVVEVGGAELVAHAIRPHVDVDIGFVATGVEVADV
ncbi:MAG TPA: hypothetical protein VHR97_14055 [Candidatus Baltobacteraceae bacterium]|jgi:hypothetical protein|nr:hypothetical protein [Candidatus Baltobacteraceae bacterium]